MAACPDWSDDGPATRTPEFYAAVAEAYRAAEDLAKKRIIGTADVKTFHRILFRRFVPLAYYAGNFRQLDPNRPCLGREVQVGTVPGCEFRQVVRRTQIAFAEVRVLSSNLEIRWPTLSPGDRAVQLSQVIAYAVGVFIQIHPFLNGNGRVSRLIWTWGVLRFGLPVQCRIAARPGPPYEQLMDSAMRGDLVPLAMHILTTMAKGSPPTLSTPP